MRMITKETFAALVLLIASIAATAQSPCSADACLPCGAVITNAPNVSYEPPVVPITNLIATSSCCRNLNNYFGGFYVGVGWGLGIADWGLELVNPGVAHAEQLTGLDSDTRSYLVGIANAGFNLVLGYFSLGIEAGYNYRSRTDPTSHFDMIDQFNVQFDDVDLDLLRVRPCQIRYDINSQHAATLDILPGFVYSRFTTYLRLGVEKAQYKLQRRVCFPFVFADVEQFPFEAVVDDQEFIFSPSSKSETGYRIGLGFGVAACCNLSFHLNYIHTFGQKLSFTPDIAPILANAPVIVPPETVISTVAQLGANIIIEPERDEVNLTMRWTF